MISASCHQEPVQPPPSLPHETGSAGHEGGRARPSVHPGGDLHVPGQTTQILKLSDHEGETPIRHQLRPGSPQWLTNFTLQNYLILLFSPAS